VDPLEYSRRKASVAQLVCTNQAAVHKAAMMLRRAMPKVEEEPELSQASKAVAIGIKESLWRSPDKEAYATVKVADHTENFRIKSIGYEQWLRQEYAERYKIRVAGEWLPQVPGAGALKDALGTLASQALFRGDEHLPATRVGWDESAKAIWIDLGDAEWRSVKVTAEGWRVVSAVGVRFIRSSGMPPLPVPRRGGSIQELLPLLNVRREDFVLIPGWQAQALNPRGSYPIMGLSAASEMGKSTVSRLILQTVDPSRKYLRHRPRSVEDLLVIAKNNWTLGFDNFRGISNEMSDTLCMLCTGIATGKRANYTDDEEAGFVVQRPLLFNGIAAELGSQSDLLSRTIRLQLPTLQDVDRRFDEDIKAEFAEVWPVVLGALLDGLVAGLAGWRRIKIAQRARLADFEAFAEAACRGMGFREGEFEAAYRANRNAQMQMNVESNAVGKAILQMMRGMWKGKGGFAGQMSALYALPRPSEPGAARYWPNDPTRLSTRLRELRRPLEAVGVRVEFDVDRRPVGGSQKDVVISWIAGRAESS
jgi:putative DNA primase/helicase